MFPNVEAYVIRCGQKGELVLIRSPFELWEDDEIMERAMVSSESLEMIVRLTKPSEWHVFGSKGATPKGG